MSGNFGELTVVPREVVPPLVETAMRYLEWHNGAVTSDLSFRAERSALKVMQTYFLTRGYVELPCSSPAVEGSD